jgi:hypothetical protein
LEKGEGELFSQERDFINLLFGDGKGEMGKEWIITRLLDE